jgi:hypothetical protein
VYDGPTEHRTRLLNGQSVSEEVFLKNLLFGTILVGAIFACSASAETIVSLCPADEACFGGLAETLPAAIFDPATGSFVSPIFTFTDSIGDVLTGQYTYFTDPEVDFSFGFTNHSATAQTFTLTFLDPYVGGPYDEGFSSIATDYGVIGATTSFSATPGPTFSDIMTPCYGLNPLDCGPASGNTVFAALPGGCIIASVPLPSGSCNIDSADVFPLSPLAPATGDLLVTISATVGPGDRFSGTGDAGLDNVTAPEPSTLCLMGLSFGLAGLMRRRRK